MILGGGDKVGGGTEGCKAVGRVVQQHIYQHIWIYRGERGEAAGRDGIVLTSICTKSFHNVITRVRQVIQSFSVVNYTSIDVQIIV